MSWFKTFRNAVKPLKKGEDEKKDSEANEAGSADSGIGADGGGSVVNDGGADDSADGGTDISADGDAVDNDGSADGSADGGSSADIFMDATFKSDAIARLSPREKEVFDFCLRGEKMKFMAAKLNIKTSTVNGYCRDVYRKLRVNSKAQLILLYSDFKNIK